MPLLKNLRKLYGRSPTGQTSREYVKATITPETMNIVRSLVNVHKGGEGSAFIELSIRLMVVLLGNNDDELELIAGEINESVESPTFIQNLERLARLLKA